MSQKQSGIIDVEDIRSIQKFLGKNWLILFILPLLFAGLSYFYTHRLPEIFAAKTEILLKSGAEYDYQSQVYSNLIGFYQNYADITNQKRVLTSYDLISKTLNHLNFELSYYIVGRVKTRKVDLIGPVNIQIDLINQNLYHQFINFWIEDEDHFKIIFELNGETIERIHPFDFDVITNEYLMRVDRTHYFHEEKLSGFKEIHYQFMVHTQSSLVENYRRSISIENLEYTSILILELQDQLATRAKMFLDTLAYVYVNYTVENQKLLNANTIYYIDAQLNKVSSVLDSIESELEGYKSRNTILDLSREEEQYFSELVNYESRKRELELQLQSLESLQEYLLTADDENLLPPSLYILEDDYLESSLNELYTLQFEKNRALYDVTAENQKVISGDRTIESAKKDILIYIKNNKIAILGKIQDFSAQIRDYEHKIRGIPSSERDIVNINRKLKVNEEMYLFLLEKKANTEIAKAAIIPQTSIIEKARSIGQVGPDRTRNLLMFTGSGFILALLIGFIRYTLYDRIENLRELKLSTAIPVIGGIPVNDKAKTNRLVISDEKDDRGNIAESFRAIRTNLQYFKHADTGNVIMITSLHPGEGKTFCSVNIAAIIAKAGKKVLLIDFDLHKPKIHGTFKMDNEFGVSSSLINLRHYTEVIKHTEIPTLDVITSGSLPPNASELLLSPKVEELLEEAKQNYEYVIIDTPPIMMISDALVLQKHANISIFVMNTKVATKQGTKYLNELIESNKVTNASILLNNIVHKGWRYYYGKYASRYGYSYGYSYDYGYSYRGNYYDEEPKEQQ